MNIVQGDVVSPSTMISILEKLFNSVKSYARVSGVVVSGDLDRCSCDRTPRYNDGILYSTLRKREREREKDGRYMAKSDSALGNGSRY